MTLKFNRNKFLKYSFKGFSISGKNKHTSFPRKIAEKIKNVQIN